METSQATITEEPVHDAEPRWQPIPCPFVYASGKACQGVVTRIEAFKADLEWRCDADGEWGFGWGSPRSHYHLYCSLRENHAGYQRDDDSRMKFWLNELPDGVAAVLRVRKPPAARKADGSGGSPAPVREPIQAGRGASQIGAAFAAIQQDKEEKAQREQRRAKRLAEAGK